MGLLDDAIREHLDLKRRNGADPAELERAEREALGPVRREPEARPEEPALAEPVVATSVDQETQAWPAPTEPEYDDEDEEAEPEPEPAPRRSRLSRIFGRSEDDEEDEEDAEDELEAAPPAGPAETLYGEETRERALPDEEELAADRPVHNAGHAEHEDGHEDDAEDVLDQTPEFLQDTPDHDRLWFEQRPPRDFDFDG